MRSKAANHLPKQQEGGKASTNRENHDSKVSVNTDKQLRQSIRY
jgi:hypothetical protein